LDPARSLPKFFPVCVALCVAEGIAGDDWALEAHVIQQWQFTDARGQLVQPTQSPTGNEDFPLTVHSTWDGAWHASLLLSENLYALCASSLEAYAQPPGALIWTATGAPGGIEGCVSELQSTNDAGTPTAGAVIVMTHFGVVLAANDEAHRV